MHIPAPDHPYDHNDTAFDQDPSVPNPWDLPHDETAERAVLGAILLPSPTALAEVRAMLTGVDFYRPAHETIFNTAVDLADNGRPVDALTVARALGDDLRRIGGAIYLHTCIQSVPVAATAAWYAQIILDKAYARRVIEAGCRLAQIGRSEEMDSPLRACVRAEYAALLEAETRGWTDPAPLTTGVTMLPEFPADVLPKWIAEKVAAVADETQTPMDLAASVALATLATACGGKARVLVRPELSWSEPVNLWTVTALPPGTRKSPVFNSITAPLLAAEEVLRDAAVPRIIEARLTRQIAEQRAERAATAAAKATLADRVKAEAEAHDAAHELAEATVPEEPQLVVDDITPETAASMLADQGGRLSILSAESEIFTIMAGRYSGTPSMNVFLKGHAGDLMRVNRKTRAAESVKDPALTMGICTQPSVLRDLAAIPGASGRGLLGRFLYALPTVNFGHRKTDVTKAEAATHAKYATNLHALTLTMADQDEPISLALSPEAAQLERDASARYEKRMADGGDLAGIRDWAGKAIGAAMRIAGLMHLAEHLTDGYDKPISGTAAAGALAVIDYYAVHALAAFDAMSTDETAIRARAVLDWIERTQPARFTARQAFTALARSRFPKISDLDSALTILDRHGYIRRLPDAPISGRGRPSAPAYETHPDIGA